MFREVLNAPDLAVTDDFFEWGGDSLKAFTLMARLAETSGIRLPATTLLTAPTARDLARERDGADRSQVRMAWLRESGDLRPLVCVPAMIGDPLWFFPLVPSLDPRRPVLGVSLVGLRPPFTVTDIARHAVAALKATQPTGPYLLLGHSFGGIVAFEMARELRSMGDVVPFVGLIDTFVPGMRRPPPATRWLRLPASGPSTLEPHSFAFAQDVGCGGTLAAE